LLEGVSSILRIYLGFPEKASGEKSPGFKKLK
jgi:hypothetical protein